MESASEPVSIQNVLLQNEKTRSVTVFLKPNGVKCRLEITRDSDEEEIRKILEKELGVTDPVNSIAFFYEDSQKKRHTIPLNSLTLFVFEISVDSQLSLQIRSKGEKAYYVWADDPWADEDYFGSYEDLDIHWEMLTDYKRCSAYYDAIMRFKEDFEGKVVLDIGCGTGILSVFCARAGAKKVYGLEASSVYIQAREFIKDNECDDVVEILHGKVEELVLPVKEVDIIVSEWMGYFLVTESMLETVLFARDKWLKKGGLLFPTEANLRLLPIYSQSFLEREDFFANGAIEGVKLKTIRDPFIQGFTKRMLRCWDIAAPDIVGDPVLIKTFDCTAITVPECRKFEAHFKIKAHEEQYYLFERRDKSISKVLKPTTSVFVACSYDNWVKHEMSFQEGSWFAFIKLPAGTYQYKFFVKGEWVIDKNAPSESDATHGEVNICQVEKRDLLFNGFGGFFDVVFRGSDVTKAPIVFSTDPRSGYQTHWKQGKLLYEVNLPVPEDRELTGDLKIVQIEVDMRHYFLTITPSEKSLERKDFPEKRWRF